MRYRKEVFTSLALITQLGIQMMTPIFLCVAVGLLIDSYFGTSSTVFLMIFGILAGARNTYILALNASKSGNRKKSDYISQEYGDKKEKDDVPK